MKVRLSEYDIAFPVITAECTSPGEYDLVGEVLGTAFLLGSGFLMTAGHVIQALSASSREPMLAIPRPGEPGGPWVTRIQKTELLGSDLGIIQVSTQGGGDAIEPILPWYGQAVDAFDNLWSVGYAYGLLLVGDQKQFHQRIFRGHSVGKASRHELSTDGDRCSAVYELSFQTPRGLSGAPLIGDFGENGRKPIVVGVIVGNSSQSMVVHRRREVDASGLQVSVYEIHESLSLGIAIQARHALGLESTLLDSTIGDFLVRRNALHPAP